MPPRGGGVNGQHYRVGMKNDACRISSTVSLLTSLLTSLWISIRRVGFPHGLTELMRLCYNYFL